MNSIDYDLIRSRRRSLSVTVRDGHVTVKAPYGMAEEAIRKFIADKRRWIESKIAEQNFSSVRFAAVRNGEALLDEGAAKPVCFGASKNAESDDAFYLKGSGTVRGYFEKTRGWLLYEYVHAFSRNMGVSPSDVSLCDFKARWGSCDADGRLKLNWRLTMLPPELRDYVIIHELSHLRELNHSAAFWRVVGRYCPNYRECRKALRDYAFLTQLYRKANS